MSEPGCATFWCDYIHTQLDPAHLLSELVLSVVFELLQLVIVVLLWRKVVKPRWFAEVHRDFDQAHGLQHKSAEAGTVVELDKIMLS